MVDWSGCAAGVALSISASSSLYLEERKKTTKCEKNDNAVLRVRTTVSHTVEHQNWLLALLLDCLREGAREILSFNKQRGSVNGDRNQLRSKQERGGLPTRVHEMSAG